MAEFWSSEQLANALAEDKEFLIAARYWTGGFTFEIGEGHVIGIKIEDGVPSAGEAADGKLIEIAGPVELWAPLLMNVPPRYMNDLGTVLALGMQLKTEPLSYTQYYPAVMRAVEVMRGATEGQAVAVEDGRPSGSFGQPTGRYVNLEVAGEDYRVYFEEAGEGIPVLLQHTAGSHGTQWRHLLEDRELTKKFRFIAYDLPFHGKSVPPTGRKWWTEIYKLRGEFLRAFVLSFSKALRLDRPVFMGCSVGGVLALDLACRHAKVFRAVISVEGALNIDPDPNTYNLEAFYHPQVSNEYKGRLMHALTAPVAPEAYRRETIQTYMAGWPPAFAGDLHYYVEDYDTRDLASGIDTSKIGVYIMNGEYDASGSWELGEVAHQTIKGSTWVKMEGVGHFPMSEHPEVFLKYLRPVMRDIEKKSKNVWKLF